MPRLLSLAHLLAAADAYQAGEAHARDIKDVLNAGGSLGGARPKAAVLSNDNRLCIAKFPHKGADEWDVMAWEEVAYRLARRAGLATARTELIKVAGRNVLLVERFDRAGDVRVGFASAMTMVEASDHESHSYLELADAIAATSTQTSADLEQLWRRIVFSICIANTDDHLRNHGFLRHGAGWLLSPAYDMNPNPDEPDRLTTAIDVADATADLELARSVASYFRLGAARSQQIIGEVAAASSTWLNQARSLGLSAQEIDRVAPAFARAGGLPPPAPSRFASLSVRAEPDLGSPADMGRPSL